MTHWPHPTHADSTHPQRSLGLASATNFRDLGGYAGHEGRSVRWGQIFRSDHLGHLSEADSAHLQQRQVRRVLDLRGSRERQGAPCVLPQAQVHSLAIEPSVIVRLMQQHRAGGKLTVPQALAAMQETYRGFVLEHSERYRQLFEHLLETDSPLVFHCTAGKDRTGLAAALVLHSLGVNRADVMHDYLLTNQYLKVRHADVPGVPEDVLAALNQVREEYLAASYAAIDQTYGSMDAYLSQALGLGPAQRAQLAQRYLTA